MELEFNERVVNVFEAKGMEVSDLKGFQEQDGVLVELVEHIGNGTQPDFKVQRFKPYRVVWRKLAVKGGVLVRQTDYGEVIVVPEGKINEVLHHIHGGPLATHYGVSKSYYKLNARFYFPCLVSRLTEFIENCEDCLKRKMPKRTPKPVNQPLQFEHTEIGSCISYDFKGPLPVADKSILHQYKSRYVLVIIDFSSRYVMAFPTPTMESRVVAEFMLSHWITKFGVPQIVISDRAPTFTGKVMSTIYKALQVEMRLTASYNPAANGLVEQVNRNISSLLMVMLEDGVSDWPKKLNILFSAYNASPQITTGYSPNYIVFGRELVEPVDLVLGSKGITGAKEKGVLEELKGRLKLRRRALELLELRFMKSNEKVVRSSMVKASGESFEVGEMVGFRVPQGPNKLFKSYEIDHQVIKKLGPSTYVIRSKTTGFERVVNVRKLRRVGADFQEGYGHKQGNGSEGGPSGFSEDEEDWQQYDNSDQVILDGLADGAAEAQDGKGEGVGDRLELGDDNSEVMRVETHKEVQEGGQEEMQKERWEEGKGKGVGIQGGRNLRDREKLKKPDRLQLGCV